MTSSRFLGGAALGLLLLLITPACSQTEDPGANTSSPETGTTEDVAINVCSELRRTLDGCSSVTVDGRTYRYLLQRSEEPTEDTTLLDIGGPGVAPLGAGLPTELIAERAHDSNVLVLDEPWTSTKPPAKCRESLSGWYTTIRSQHPSYGNQAEIDRELAEVTDTCQLFQSTRRFGWAPQQYQQVVDAIVTQEQLRLQRFDGFSFGSARWLYLNKKPASATLVSPFPYGHAASDYLRARNDVNLPTVGTVTPQVRRRSVPVTSFDVEAAQIQALYLPPRDRQILFRDPDRSYIAGRLSDQLFGRYGTDSLAPSILAFWDETCPGLTDWASQARVSPSTLLDQLFRVCAIADSNGDLPQAGILNTASPDCIVQVRGDGITPRAAVDPFLARLGWTTTATTTGGHATGRATSACTPDPSRYNP